VPNEMSASEAKNRSGTGVLILGVLAVVAVLLAASLWLVRFQKAREQDRRAQSAANIAAIRQAIAEMIVIDGEIESVEPASGETPIHAAPSSVVAPFWIVRVKVLERQKSEYPFEECNILVHSPTADLGIKSAGQKLRLVLRAVKSPPKLLAGTSAELPPVRFADPAGSFELQSHEVIE